MPHERIALSAIELLYWNFRGEQGLSAAAETLGGGANVRVVGPLPPLVQGR